MFEKILVATDGSEHGYRAANIALDLGKISGGKVTAIYVADTNRTSHLPDDMLLFSIRELLFKEGKEALKHVEDLAREKGVAYEGVVVEGNPGSEIISYAESA
ncbi:MAG: universal stress protein, partial [Methanothrix sp.]|nr:universal stress protein [Methanothrix sp.]